MGNFFAGCTNPTEVKARYRQLAKEYHPDRPNGNAAKFQALAAEYAAVKDKPPVYQWSRQEREFAISRLVAIQQGKQLKKIWIYFAFQTTLLENGQQLNRVDLEFIAAVLGYKPAWIHYKCLENNID